MAQKAEYKILQSTNANQLGAELAAHATQNWRPILMSTVVEPAGIVITVILEHVVGS